MPPFQPDNNESRGPWEFLVPLGFLALAGVLLVLSGDAQQRIAAGLRSTVLAPFLWTQESVRTAQVRADEAQELRLRVDSLVAELSSQRTVLEENRRLRDLLELRQRGGAAFVSASAIRPGTRGSESMFLLDVGTRNGIRVNDPVVSAEGLVGVVREVGGRSALAMDWTHPDFRVSVMTVDGTAFGIVEPRHGAFREEDRLLLNGVPYHTSVGEGVAVVTSGQGSVYPRGILVGRVLTLAETEAGWRRSYWLEPAVRPGEATHVLVLTRGGEAEPGSVDGLWLPGKPGGAVPDAEGEGPPEAGEAGPPSGGGPP